MKYLLLLALFLTPVGTFAEKKKVYRKTQEVSFEGSDVDGVVRNPDGSYVHQKKGVKFQPLYKVEQKFDRNIKDSVEYLR